jgi:hypothetical protein
VRLGRCPGICEDHIEKRNQAKKNKVKKKRVGGGGDRREKRTRVSRCWGVALREGKGTDVVVVGVVVDGDLRLLSCSLWR